MILRLSWTLILAVVLWAQVDPWVGLYQSQEMRVEIRPAASGYAGSIELNGQTFPFTGQAASGRLAGAFTAGGQRFSFTATQRGNELLLVSDGHEYVLARQQARLGAVNPLVNARPSSSDPSVAAIAAARTHRSSMGLSVGVPAGWTATDYQGGVLLLPAGATFDPNRQDNPEAYLVMSQDGYTPGEEAPFAQQLSQAFVQGGARMKRSGARETVPAGRRQWTRYVWEFTNAEGRDYAFDAWITNEGSRAFVLVTVGHLAKVRSREAEVRMLAATAGFAAPRMEGGGSLADNTPEAQWWLNKLRGKVVRQFFSAGGGSGGGMTSETFRYLNADGTYSMRGSSATSVYVPGATAGGTSRSSAQGRWRIKDAGGRCYLVVQLTTGETQNYSLTKDDRYWYLNGDKAFAVDPE